MLIYSRRLFVGAMSVALIFIVLGALLAGAVVGARYLKVDLLEFLISWPGVLFSLVITIVYVKARGLIVAKV